MGSAGAYLKENAFDIVIVGGGAGGVAVAASLLKRRPKLSIAIIEPEEIHYYQPGFTLVGAGVLLLTLSGILWRKFSLKKQPGLNIPLLNLRQKK